MQNLGQECLPTDEILRKTFHTKSMGRSAHSYVGNTTVLPGVLPYSLMIVMNVQMKSALFEVQIVLKPY